MAGLSFFVCVCFCDRLTYVQMHFYSLVCVAKHARVAEMIKEEASGPCEWTGHS